MEKLIVLFLLIGTACALSTHPTGVDDSELGGHGNCHPPAPVLKNMNMSKVTMSDSSQFDGIWYLDSSTDRNWDGDTCNVYQFTYTDGSFVHNNRTYPGFLKYNLRRRYYHTTHCWKACSLPLQGYMHGWIGTADDSQCNFGEETTVHDQDSDPCHPHYRWKWDLWLLSTNYKSYSLLWLCADRSPYAILLSRSKQGLTAQQRQAAEAYLRHYGVNSRFYRTINSECD